MAVSFAARIAWASGLLNVESNWAKIVWMVMLWFHPVNPGMFDDWYSNRTLSVRILNTARWMLIYVLYMFLSSLNWASIAFTWAVGAYADG